MDQTLLLMLGIAFIACVILLSVYLKLSYHFHWFDQPDEARKLHHIAKPTSAGLIFILPLMCFLLYDPMSFPINTKVLFVALLSMLTIGGIDDFKPISAGVRLVVITVVSFGFLYVVFNDVNISLVLLMIYLLGMIWWLNLYNFMDGADGMTALHAIVTLLGYVMIFYLSMSDFESIAPHLLLVVAGLLAYLLFNFPHSRLFMGDSGSLSVAFVLACFAIYGIAMGVFDETLVISFHMIFITDTTLTLFTRMKFKHRLSQAHSLHVFQTLIRAGYSHAHVSLVYALLTTLTVTVALILHYYQVSAMIKWLILLSEISFFSALWLLFHAKKKFKQFIQ